MSYKPGKTREDAHRPRFKRWAFDRPATYRWSLCADRGTFGVIAAGRWGLFVARTLRLDRWDTSKPGGIPKWWTVTLVTYPSLESVLDKIDYQAIAEERRRQSTEAVPNG